jgi:hypothetical protein
MKPPLSPAHGTSLGTTAGITAVITVVVALSVLAQCSHLSGLPAVLAPLSLVALVLGAGALYDARNEIGRALDLASTDARESGIAAARGLTRFHLGMAGVFAGGGLAAAFRFPLNESALGWIAPALALLMSGVALARALSWFLEARRREAG